MEINKNKPKVLIDILPSRGHFNASLKMALKLKNAGYNVVYSSSDALQKNIRKSGFEMVDLPAISFEYINFGEKASRKHGFFSYLYWKLIDEKFQTAKKEVEKFRKKVVLIEPDLVLLDEQVVAKSIFYESLNIQVVSFQTKPDTRKISGLPPFTSYYLPKQNVLGRWFSQLLWAQKITTYKFNYLHNRILSLGQDNYSMLKKTGGFYGIDVRSSVDFKRSFCIGIKQVNRLVISPAAFDFPHSEKENVFRIGPLLDIKREGKLEQPRYTNLVSRLEIARKNPSEFVVYCSLGTITKRFRKEVEKFFQKIAKVATLNPNCLFVLSTGENFEVEVLFPAPDNLFIFDYVPQIDLLQFCDVMITHGGMNSITECVFNTVPMLVYPLSQSWDQPGNSARVKYHNLGLRGKLKKDTAKTISRKLNTLLNNYSFYKENLELMKTKFEENNNSNEVLEIVSNVIRENQKL